MPVIPIRIRDRSGTNRDQIATRRYSRGFRYNQGHISMTGTNRDNTKTKRDQKGKKLGQTMTPLPTCKTPLLFPFFHRRSSAPGTLFISASRWGPWRLLSWPDHSSRMQGQQRSSQQYQKKELVATWMAGSCGRCEASTP